MTTDCCSLKGVNDLKFYSQMKGMNLGISDHSEE